LRITCGHAGFAGVSIAEQQRQCEKRAFTILSKQFHACFKISTPSSVNFHRIVKRVALTKLVSFGYG
jgi:hypothetical protein